MTIITIGIDLAKNIFAVHGVNKSGHAEVVKPKLSCDQLLPLIPNLPPCTLGMEVCTAPASVLQVITVCVTARETLPVAMQLRSGASIPPQKNHPYDAWRG